MEENILIGQKETYLGKQIHWNGNHISKRIYCFQIYYK